MADELDELEAAADAQLVEANEIMVRWDAWLNQHRAISTAITDESRGGIGYGLRAQQAEDVIRAMRRTYEGARELRLRLMTLKVRIEAVRQQRRTEAQRR